MRRLIRALVFAIVHVSVLLLAAQPQLVYPYVNCGSGEDEESLECVDTALRRGQEPYISAITSSGMTVLFYMRLRNGKVYTATVPVAGTPPVLYQPAGK